ncbi:hypothetical protein BH11ACT2_BH11ACT2_00840 [soil metagenome]
MSFHAGRRPLIRLAIAVAGVVVLSSIGVPPAGASTVAVVASQQSGVTHKTVTKKVAIPYKTVTKKTASLKKGVRKTSVAGVAGIRTTVITVTYRDGVQVAKKVLTSTVTKRPVNKVVLLGTKAASSSHCDPNYAGQCVPIASDVDCGGGSGNGPGYVYGPVEVVGSDIYDLDRDGDGVGCD